MLWAWMQEKQLQRPPGTYNSACCLCVPRVLYLSPDGSTLLQEPLPELRELRQQQGAWHVGAQGHSSSSNGNGSAGVQLVPGQPLRVGAGVGGFSSSSVDLELQIAKGDADSFALVLHSFEGVAGAAGAAISYCWSTNTLQVGLHTHAAPGLAWHGAPVSFLPPALLGASWCKCWSAAACVCTSPPPPFGHTTPATPVST